MIAGAVFGIAALVAVFTGAGGYASPHLFSDGFTAANVSAPRSGGDGLGALLRWRRSRRTAQVATVSAPSCSEIATSIE